MEQFIKEILDSHNALPEAAPGAGSATQPGPDRVRPRAGLSILPATTSSSTNTQWPEGQNWRKCGHEVQLRTQRLSGREIEDYNFEGNVEDQIQCGGVESSEEVGFGRAVSKSGRVYVVSRYRRPKLHGRVSARTSCRRLMARSCCRDGTGKNCSNAGAKLEAQFYLQYSRLSQLKLCEQSQANKGLDCHNVKIQQKLSGAVFRALWNRQAEKAVFKSAPDHRSRANTGSSHEHQFAHLLVANKILFQMFVERRVARGQAVQMKLLLLLTALVATALACENPPREGAIRVAVSATTTAPTSSCWEASPAPREKKKVAAYFKVKSQNYSGHHYTMFDFEAGVGYYAWGTSAANARCYFSPVPQDVAEQPVCPSTVTSRKVPISVHCGRMTKGDLSIKLGGVIDDRCVPILIKKKKYFELPELCASAKFYKPKPRRGQKAVQREDKGLPTPDS
uniref:ZP domain-containing protein n=1 Tax=Macrostomum lignano TaxID=282301 RepID=A0A1I8F7C2_9PLAT